MRKYDPAIGWYTKLTCADQLLIVRILTDKGYPTIGAIFGRLQQEGIVVKDWAITLLWGMWHGAGDGVAYMTDKVANDVKRLSARGRAVLALIEDTIGDGVESLQIENQPTDGLKADTTKQLMQMAQEDCYRYDELGNPQLDPKGCSEWSGIFPKGVPAPPSKR